MRKGEKKKSKEQKRKEKKRGGGRNTTKKPPHLPSLATPVPACCLAPVVLFFKSCPWPGKVQGRHHDNYSQKGHDPTWASA